MDGGNQEGKSLVETAVDEIIQLILDNGMRSGDRLPNEFELAQRLGVGRSTLREATRRLVARNVLAVRQGAGTFVSDKMGVPEDPLGLTFLGDDPKLGVDLIDIRMMLEPEIAAMAAIRATEEQTDRLHSCCREIDERIDSGSRYADADARFHRGLAECSGNDVLRNLIPIITSSVSITISTTNDQYRCLTNSQHRSILEAVRRRDPLGAKAAMVTHLSMNREFLIRSCYQSDK